MKHWVKKCWRGVGDQEYDIFHRDTRKEMIAEGCVGEPEEVWSVGSSADEDTVIADCYTRQDANKVAKALSK